MLTTSLGLMLAMSGFIITTTGLIKRGTLVTTLLGGTLVIIGATVTQATLFITQCTTSLLAVSTIFDKHYTLTERTMTGFTTAVLAGMTLLQGTHNYGLV